MIDAARDLYGNYSIYEVIDQYRSSAIERMVEMYGPEVDMEKVERHFFILACSIRSANGDTLAPL